MIMHVSKRVALLFILVSSLRTSSALRGRNQHRRKAVENVAIPKIGAGNEKREKGKDSFVSVMPKVSNVVEEEDMFFAEGNQEPVTMGVSEMAGHPLLERNDGKTVPPKSKGAKVPPPPGVDLEVQIDLAGKGPEGEEEAEEEEEVETQVEEGEKDGSEPVQSSDGSVSDESPDVVSKTESATLENFSSYDDPEAPTSAPPAVDKADLLSYPSTDVDTTTDTTNTADPAPSAVFGGDMVEPVDYFDMQSDYHVKEKLVPAETLEDFTAPAGATPTAHQESHEQPKHPEPYEAPPIITRIVPLFVVGTGILIFISSLLVVGLQKQEEERKREAAKIFELSFHDDNSILDRGTENEVLSNTDGSSDGGVEQDLGFLHEGSPKNCQKDERSNRSTHDQWEETSDPWSFDGNEVAHGTSRDEAFDAAISNGHDSNQIGQRISTIMQGTINKSRKQIRTRLAGERGGYKEFFEYSETSDSEDPERDPHPQRVWTTNDEKSGSPSHPAQVHPQLDPNDPSGVFMAEQRI